MKKCTKCDLEMDDLSKFEICYSCRHDSVIKQTEEVKSIPEIKNEDIPLQKKENNKQTNNQSFDEQVLYHINKQTKILIEQHKHQRRISNNILFFFWITIIGFVLSFLMVTTL